MPEQHMDLMSRTLHAASSSKAQAQVPFSRRRMQPNELQALQSLYDIKTHPSKDDRIRLARELNLDIKTVNVWYQNKRRSMKKKLLKWTEAENSSIGSRASSILAPKTHPLLRRNPSYTLDSIASRRERRDTRPPLRPRRHASNQAADGFDFSEYDWRPKNIYDLIPSSPLQPPSSPGTECMLLSGLPPTSKVKRSLEFACAKDRADRRKRAVLRKGLVDSDEDELEEMDLDVPELALDEDSESEGEDMITPDTSLQSMSVPDGLLDTPTHKGKGKEKAGSALRADEEAARALLAFRGA